jgi:archaellum component FlaC
MTKDTVNIHGKQYETVASRVSRFRDEYKQELAIVTELIDRDAETVVMKASIVKGDQILAQATQRKAGLLALLTVHRH